MKMSWKPDSTNGNDRLELKWTQTEHPLTASTGSLDVTKKTVLTSQNDPDTNILEDSSITSGLSFKENDRK